MADKSAEDESSQLHGNIWIWVFVTECIVIFIINAFTLIGFARNPAMRKRTTYLIINLTVADLLVGAVTGPLEIKYTYQVEPKQVFSWRKFCILTFGMLFPVLSLLSLSLISLERLHASLYPCRHCLIGNWVYFKVIICCWLLAWIFASLVAVIYSYEPVANLHVLILASYRVITFLILAVSYIIIIIVKVKKSPSPQYSGAVASDRKLSVTLSIVTIVSVLTILPRGIHVVIPNSMVNPLIYTVRMREFRKMLQKVICKTEPLERTCNQPIELHEM